MHSDRSVSVLGNTLGLIQSSPVLEVTLKRNYDEDEAGLLMFVTKEYVPMWVVKGVRFH